MQLLPADDLFDAGSASFGSHVCLYIPLRVTTATITGIWNPAGGTFVRRPLHGGYQTMNGASGLVDYNAAFHSSGSNSKNPSGALFRRPFALDHSVSAIFEMRAVAGNAPLSDLAPRGVVSRAQAGTLVSDGTPDFAHENVTCYLAACYEKADGTLRLGILRSNTGTLVLLAESAAIPTTTLDMKRLATVKLTVSGTVTVALTATLVGFGGVGQIASVSHNDSSGSRISTAGRCGLFMGPDRTFTGPARSCVDLCHVLRVEEAGVAALSDEFRRLSLAGAKQTTADLHAVTGGLLSSAFFWDAHSFDSSFTVSTKTYQGAVRLRRNATNQRIDFNHATTDDDVGASRAASGRLILSQRPATNLFSQHRSIKVLLPNAGHPTAATGEVWAGIALRALQARPAHQATGTPDQAIAVSPNVPFGTGYILACRAKTSTQVIWQLHRVVNNTHVEVARKTENSVAGSWAGLVFPGYGLQFTLELEVYPRNELDPTGPVVLVCKVDGAVVTFSDPLSLPVGWKNPSAGVYHDESSSRIRSNAGEGLFVCNGLTSSGSTAADYDPIFEAWTQLALTNAAVLDVDQGGVAVADEGTPVGADLVTVTGPFVPEVEPVIYGIKTPFESGHVQTMPLERDEAGVVMRRDRLKASNLVLPEWRLDALLDYWDEHRGTELAFNFTPDGGSTVKCHFLGDGIRFVPIEPSVYSVSFELERLY